jgi:hypothetical protein
MQVSFLKMLLDSFSVDGQSGSTVDVFDFAKIIPGRLVDVASAPVDVADAPVDVTGTSVDVTGTTVDVFISARKMIGVATVDVAGRSKTRSA